jgi:hypothetical protein
MVGRGLFADFLIRFLVLVIREIKNWDYSHAIDDKYEDERDLMLVFGSFPCSKKLPDKVPDYKNREENNLSI